MSLRTKIEAGVMVLVIITALAIYGFIYSQNAQAQWSKLQIARSISSETISKIVNQKLKLEFDTLEIAKTEQERQIGYMNRESICAKCGMLFVFEKSQPLSFWMKNTLVPLKIIFIDENGVVINSGLGIPKQTNPAVSSTKPAKYVLEVPQESTIDPKPNQIIDIQDLLAKGISHTTVKESGDFK